LKGLLFTELIDFIERHSDIETAESIIQAAELESSGAYTAVGNYSHLEAVQLVNAATAKLGIPQKDLMRLFGKELFSRLYESYPAFFEEGMSDAASLLARIEDHIHVEVRKLYTDSKPPSVVVSDGDGGLVVTYKSHRPFAIVAMGLVEGCFEYFRQPVQIRIEGDLDLTSSTARFSIVEARGV
jgi:hypothetical protein